MSNPFDFDKAKAGEPVEYDISGGRLVPAHFIGVSAEGYMVIQHKITDSTKMTTAFCCKESELRMAPKKVKVRYRVGIFSELGDTWPAVTNSDKTAALWEKTDSFKGWIMGWREAEVDQ
jgi:hypothetical protein